MLKNYMLLFGLLFSLNITAQSLTAGDIAFIGMNTDATEGYSFISLTDIPGNEIIFFSDRGIISSAAYITGTEGTYRFTAPPAGISCGTIVSFNETSADVYTISGVTGATMVLQTGSANLGSGDQVYAYQTAGNVISTVPSDATFLAGIMCDYDAICVDAGTFWTQSACVSSTSESIVPPGLTNGVNCISITPTGPEVDNMRYTGTLTGTSTALRGLINNSSQWTDLNNSPAYDITPTGYASPSVTCVAACSDHDVPTAIVATPSTICSGLTSTLTWTGALNDATQWHIYTGACGGTQVGTTASNSFTTAVLTGNTTFYIRGEGGCVTPGTCSSVVVTVNANPTVTFTALADLCVNTGVQAGLGSGFSIGGVYSGAGVTDDGNGQTYSFDPAAAGVGIHTITYNFTNANGCSGSANDNVEVFALPIVTFTALADLCVNAGVQAGLGSGLSIGGVYSGAGVTDDGNGQTYSFDPAAAGVGIHTITYNFTNANGCSGSANDNVEVFALPTVTFTALADLPVDSGVQAGLGGGLPTGGVYSGAGVTDDGNGMTYSFDPAAAGEGIHTITYSFTNANGCSNSANDNVEVEASLGIHENVFGANIGLYPNPNKGDFTLNYSGQEQLKELLVTDMLGKRVQTISLENFDNSQYINLTALAKGMYFITIQSESAKVTKRMIIE